MAYREPGVYLKMENSGKYAAAASTALIPLIIGSGATVFKRTVAITRSDSLSDILPNSQVVNIISVGSSDKIKTWNSPTDYTFETPNKINWVSGAGPEAGETYYVTYTYKAEDTQYAPKICTTISDVETYFGGDFKEYEDGSINRIAVAAKIALESGAPAIYVLQVKPNASGQVTAAEYQTALEQYARFLPVWRIVPVDLDANINSAIDQHVLKYSTPEERMERTVIYGAAYTGTLTTFNDTTGVYSVIGDYAAGKKNERIIVIYPDVATKVLNNGKLYELNAPFICAAIAGAECAQPVSRSRTRMPIKAFYELKGVKMTRTEKNLLAQKGVMILEQPQGPGTDIIIRHQLTTDMTNVQTREASIIAIKDYAAKYFREICEQYIGKYVINSETLMKIKTTLEMGIHQLIKEGILNDGKITLLMQDAENPDTVVVSMSILPPYPCNYIDITVVLE